MLTADEVIRLLELCPHPQEGGFFRETYRSLARIPASALDSRHADDRSISTAIYYLLTPTTFSEMHRLVGDELFHFYMGDPVEMLQLYPDGSGQVVRLGTDLASGERPQLVVPGGVWQGSRLVAGGRYALLGTTMAPGFEYRDYETGARASLARAYPIHADLIVGLTRPAQ